MQPYLTVEKNEQLTSPFKAQTNPYVNTGRTLGSQPALFSSFAASPPGVKLRPARTPGPYGSFFPIILRLTLKLK